MDYKLGVPHEEVKHPDVRNCLSSVEERHEVCRLRRRGSGACEPQVDFQNPAAIFLSVLHVQVADCTPASWGLVKICDNSVGLQQDPAAVVK